MNGLYPDFIERLQEALLVCAPFDDYTALTHLFVDERIYPWRNMTRYRPNSLGLIDEVIFQLHDRYNQEGTNALLLFLRVIRDRTDKEDACYNRLDVLARELEKALAASESAGKPAFTMREPVSEPLGERSRGRQQPENRPPPPSPRLEALGFVHDPFAWREAEKISPPQILEELFVAHPEFDSKVMLLNRTTVLVAPRGSGKTAGRLTLQERLNQLQQVALAPYRLPGDKRIAPFVVTYDQFEQLIPRLPVASLLDHQDLLAAALASALLKFITAYPGNFLALETRSRSWWWSYLATYLRGLPLHFAVADEALQADWDRQRETLVTPFAPSVSIRELLSSFLERLRDHFGISRLFILVDGVDGYVETQSRESLRALLSPLLGALSLLSLPDIIWKFFLPNSTEELVRDSAGYRTGRIELSCLEWNETTLVELLQRRLAWASEGAIAQLDAVAGQKLRSIGVRLESELARFALSYRYGPPRAMLVMAERLFYTGAAHNEAPALLSEAEWFRFRRWIGQDVRAHQREQTRNLKLQTGEEQALFVKCLNALNDDALFLVQRAWNEIDFYATQPGELKLTLDVLHRVLTRAGYIIDSAANEDIDINTRIKMVIPPVVAFLIAETPVTVDAQWIPARVVVWLRRIAEGWLRTQP